VSLLRSTWIALSSVRWSRGSSPVRGPSPFAAPGASLAPPSAWLAATAARIASASAAIAAALDLPMRRFMRLLSRRGSCSRRSDALFRQHSCELLHGLNRPKLLQFGEMTATPRTARGSATRGRIVAAAAALIREQGIAETSLDDILERAGASKSQLYLYFENR